MNTSSEALKQLEQSLAAAKQAVAVLDGVIVEHDYQDVASLVAQAAVSLLESATALMQSDDETALEALEASEDFIDAVYKIIDADLDED